MVLCEMKQDILNINSNGKNLYPYASTSYRPKAIGTCFINYLYFASNGL